VGTPDIEGRPFEGCEDREVVESRASSLRGVYQDAEAEMTDTETTRVKEVVWGIAMVVGAALFLVGIITTICAHWETRDAISWKNEARRAGDAAQMAEFTDKCLAEMDRLGMSEGWTAVIWKTPSRDMAVTYARLQQIADRARFVAENPELNVLSQAQILEDLRTNLYYTDISRVNWWCIHHGMWFFLPVFLWPTIIGCILVFLILPETMPR